MKHAHPHLAVAVRVETLEQRRHLDAVRRHLMNKTVQVVLIQVCLPVTVDKPDIRQQRSLEEFLLGDNMERPTLFTGQSLGHGQLALNNRAIESLGGFCFH